MEFEFPRHWCSSGDDEETPDGYDYAGLESQMEMAHRSGQGVRRALPCVEAIAGPKTTPDGVAFPFILSFLQQPPGASRPFSPRAWAVANKQEIYRLLARHGCILFRGFPLPDAASFGSFVSGFKELVDLPYEDSLSLAVRAPVVDRVCTTNEGRSGGLVWHHEQAAAPRFPSKARPCGKCAPR